MRVLTFACASLCVVLCCASASVVDNMIYPDARRDDTVVDDYHGTKIKDPYRWLEDPESKETMEFVEAQNNITGPFIDSCPEKEDIKKRITELWDFPKYLCPFRRGHRYFFFKNSGLQSQKVMYVQDSLEGEPRVFFDVNTLSKDGTVSLSTYAFSEDGATFAYGLSASGSDWITIHFRNVATGEDYPETLKKVKLSILSWTHDNKGLFYSAYPAQQGKTDGSETVSNRDQKLCYHRLDTPQSEDVIVAEFPEEPLWKLTGQVTDDGLSLLVAVVRDYRNNKLYVADLGPQPNITGLLPLKQITFDEFDSEYGYVTTEGSKSIFRTNKNAPNYRLVKIDFSNPAEENWETLIPGHESDVLDFAAPVNNDKLTIHYIRDVKSALQLHDLKTGELVQPFDMDVGTVADFSGKKDQTEIFFYFWSFLTPGIIYHVDFNNTAPYKPKVFREIKVKGFDASQYESKQIFYTSKDGTKVPMFIVSKKGLPRDGSNPALLHGYGGFSLSIYPAFNIMRLVFMQHLSGVIAVPNIRGGGEYGERWYNGGRLLNKQNVFDDFQAAAEYLIAENYTRPDLLTIQGGSNGGLLVAACINQRPELYGAAIAQIGVLDLLRFHKFTVGHAWVSDYGNPDNKTEFEYILKYSPLHNVKAPGNGRAQYPATLVLTADHDDRVVPLHSLKFIAALQHEVRGSSQTRPLLARVDTKAGHGGGKPTAKIIAEETDVLCFITKVLNLKYVK